ncbi:MAG TPA: hypothetical protein VEZ41_16620 [Allosphingosinicella sp.]|nr:hypothetical protein [Allosphingosinicella sp.]
MKDWASALLLCSAALTGCSSGQPEAGADGAIRNRDALSAPPPSAPNGMAAEPGVDPNLPEEIAMVVTMLKDKLPLRQGGATIVDMEARGAEIIHTIQVPQDLDQVTFAHFQAQLPLRTCGDPAARWAVDRGGTVTYKILDKDAEEFTASVAGCPMAAPPVEATPIDDPAAVPPPEERK